MPKKTSEERADQLLDALEKQKARADAAEAKLEAKEKSEAKEKDPMSGPGNLCQVTDITLSEAWQLKSQERVNLQTGTEEMVTDPAPEGFADRQGPNNAHFVVKPEDMTIPLKDSVIPNCQSKYTRELQVFGPKLASDKGNFKKEPPKIKMHLCEKHEKMFGAKEIDKKK